mmetsp:Transcript_163923/g.398362  ORF Transcript_163923/g.398362 Transcript_163923/m.398362 type:complete len:93 (-) Transcript_163923:256-534(-)
MGWQQSGDQKGKVAYDMFVEARGGGLFWPIMQEKEASPCIGDPAMRPVKLPIHPVQQRKLLSCSFFHIMRVLHVLIMCAQRGTTRPVRTWGR